jgi:hypothetical protein
MKRLMGCLGGAVLAGLLLSGCGDTVPAAVAGVVLDEGDYVYSGVGPVEASNLERFDAFLAVTESGGDDAVRIVTHTVEGDPIYTDISYREGKYEVFYDASEDAFASADGRKRAKAAECTSLVPSDRQDEYSEFTCGEFTFMLRKL